MKKRPILKLNKNYFPIGTGEWRDIITQMFSGAVHPLDIMYAQQDNGNADEMVIEGFNAVRTWEEWSKLEVRDCDDFVHTSHGQVRLPSIVVCANYGQIKFKNVLFPTNHNIHKRDNYTCVYSGKKLQKHELSIDHVIPQSRGGGNTWENLVCCDRELNTFKDNRTPSEAGLRLLYKPFKPNNGMGIQVCEALRGEWNMFLKGE
jgi:5-methylcytosine-specific restriction endonuclease McrA